jgi:hypothetical protein
MVVPRKKYQIFDVVHVEVTGLNKFWIDWTMVVNVGMKFVIKTPHPNNKFLISYHETSHYFMQILMTAGL